MIYGFSPLASILIIRQAELPEHRILDVLYLRDGSDYRCWLWYSLVGATFVVGHAVK